MKVLKSMGFYGSFVDEIWRLVANNQYSVLINGQSYEFFHSFRGVKQGDPLSPTPFILTTEVLSRTLNNFFENKNFKDFGLPKYSDRKILLEYDDYTIIFCAAQKLTLEMVMDNLKEYEKQSSQKINKDKSSFYVS